MIPHCATCRFWNGSHRDEGVELFNVDEPTKIIRLPERRECTNQSVPFFLKKSYSSVYVPLPHGYRFAQMTTADDVCENYAPPAN